METFLTMRAHTGTIGWVRLWMPGSGFLVRKSHWVSLHGLIFLLKKNMTNRVVFNGLMEVEDEKMFYDYDYA